MPPRAIPLDSPSSPACGAQCRNFTLQRTWGPGRRALDLAGPGRAGSRELTFCAPSQIRRRLVYVSFFLPETSFSHRFPHTEPGLQPNFARGTYQCRNSTSGCLLAPLRGLCHHFESAALPDSRPLTLAPPYAVFSDVRPSASIPFDPAALSETAVVDGRAAACVCGLRGGGGRDSIVAGARGVDPGTYDAPGLSRRRHGDGSKAVMSLCCGSISSSFRAPAGVRPTVLRASTAPGKPHPRRAASGRTRRPPAAAAARRLRERIPPARPRTSHPLLRLTRRSRRRRAENLLPPIGWRLKPSLHARWRRRGIVTSL